MFSSDWCAAEGQLLWWQGGAVLSDKEIQFLHSDTEGHREAGCSLLQNHCGSHLQKEWILPVSSNEPVDGKHSVVSLQAFKEINDFFLKISVWGMNQGSLRLCELRFEKNTFFSAYIRATKQCCSNKTGLFFIFTNRHCWLWTIPANCGFCSQTKHKLFLYTHLWLELHDKAAEKDKSNKVLVRQHEIGLDVICKDDSIH